MAQYSGPLLGVAAIGALGAYTPERELQQNVYADLDDCRRDYGDGACALERANGATRAVGPWYPGTRAGALASSQHAIGVETRRGGFGGWACSGEGSGGGSGGGSGDKDEDKDRDGRSGGGG